jgi:hypothetical protein
MLGWTSVCGTQGRPHVGSPIAHLTQPLYIHWESLIVACLRPDRVYIGCFSEEIGGQAAAIEWAARIDSILNYRRINKPLPAVGGLVSIDDLTYDFRTSNAQARKPTPHVSHHATC